MNYMYDYEYEEVENQSYSWKTVKNLFPNEKEAIFALYEQLFCTIDNVCQETILEAMKYLVYSKEMTNQMEEMKEMTKEDVPIVHHRAIDRGVEKATKEFKEKLYNVLEDKFL